MTPRMFVVCDELTFPIKQTNCLTYVDSIEFSQSSQRLHAAVDGVCQEEIPTGSCIVGSVRIYKDFPCSLPDNLTVTGNLEMVNSIIKKLPDNLVVGGNININGSKIVELPDNLVVGGNIFAYQSSLSYIGFNITIGKRLWISTCNIARLPACLKTGGVVLR